MPNKNWLIRTKSNHILGPVSKEKVIELYHNGSVRPEDEICSGNGYWFYLREKDQVEHYLLGSKKQPFNPISEAIDVLTVPSGRPAAKPVQVEDITLVGGINLADLKDGQAKTRPHGSVQVRTPTREAPVARAPAIVAVEKIDPPDEEPEAAAPHETQEVELAPSNVRLKIAEVPTPVSPGKQLKKKSPGVIKDSLPLKKRVVSDKVVMISTIVVLLVLAGLLYYRKRLLKEFMTHLSPLASAYAQELSDEPKKKVFLNH